jgi:ATP-dependent Clp protease protease subunit
MKQPLRVFEGTAQPHEAFWRVVDATGSESGEPEIEFYGVISEFSWFEDDITPNKFKADLNRLGQGGPVTIRINSPGGEVWAASTIRAIMMDYPGRITVRIDGLCASAATIVATAGDRVLMQDSAYFMIHEAWLIAIGNVEDLKKAIDFLKVTNQGIVETYQSKTGMDSDKLAKLMKDATWMTARQAKENGFIDEVITSTGKTLNQSGYGQAAFNLLRDLPNVPAGLLEHEPAAAVTEPPTGQPSPAEALPVDGTEREAQRLRDYLDIFA